MGDWPVSGGQIHRANHATALANSRGIAVTPSATANTKGGYTALVTSTNYDLNNLVVFITGPVASSADYLVDIAVGGAGSEQVVVANLTFSEWTVASGVRYHIPLAVPLGTRISARCQCTAATGGAINVHLSLGAGGLLQGYSRVTTYGADTTDSGGTLVDPGGTANTRGAYSQLTASTTAPISGLALGFGNQINSVRTDCRWLIDIAVGAAASEQVIIPDVNLEGSAAMDSVWPIATPFFPVAVPSGSRLSCRASCSIIDATDRLFDVIAYGVT